MRHIGVVGILALGLTSGCTPSAPKSKGPSRRSVAGAHSAAVTPGAAQAVTRSETAAIAEARKRGFKPDDFVESDTNRDPFRSYLNEFSGGVASDQRQYKIVLPKYSLDELRLVAIIGPPTQDIRGRPMNNEHQAALQARAMFIDPLDKGVSVLRGDHISKADAKVVRISPEKGKVYLEVHADLKNGKIGTLERVLELHPPNEQLEAGFNARPTAPRSGSEGAMPGGRTP